MFACILLLNLIALQFAYYAYFKGPDIPRLRMSFVYAYTTLSALLVAATECLSLFHQINFNGIFIFWAVSFVVSSGAACILYRKRSPVLVFRKKVFPISLEKTLAAAAIAIIALITLALALKTPPNYWDANTYQMPRVFHWIQNQSVAFYPTHISRQLYIFPGSEYVILHLQVLSGTDHLANLVQWLHMAGSLVGVSLIARRLGCLGPFQWLAAIIAATVPMGIIQATSTQTDYGAALWLTYFIYYFLEGYSAFPVLAVLGTGLSLGLALLAKPTAYFFGFPFFVWFVLKTRKTVPKHWFKIVLGVCLLAVLMNAGQYKRNLETYHHPLGKKSFFLRQKTDKMSPALFLSNVVRNINLQLTTPYNPLNVFFSRATAGLHHLLNLQENDLGPITDELDSAQDPYFAPISYKDANLFHFLAFVLFSFFLIFRIRHHDPWYFWLALIAGFLIFCFFFKYTYHNRRYILPLFVLAAPWMASIYQASCPHSNSRGKLRPWIMGMVFFAAATPWLLFTPRRQLIGPKSVFARNRFAQYFEMGPFSQSSYTKAVKFIRRNGFSQIGVVFSGAAFEYPFLVLLKTWLPYPFRVEHVSICNPSKRIKRQREFHPEVIVVFLYQLQRERAQSLTCGKHTFKKVRQFPGLFIYTREE